VKVQKRGKRDENILVQTAQIINTASYCVISGNIALLLLKCH